MNKTLATRLGAMDGFFHKLTGVFSKDITGGTKEVDELINQALFRLNKSLEVKTPFPTLVESQGNVFEYEDFPKSRIECELSDANDRLINSQIAKRAENGGTGKPV